MIIIKRHAKGTQEDPSYIFSNCIPRKKIKIIREDDVEVINKRGYIPREKKKRDQKGWLNQRNRIDLAVFSNHLRARATYEHNSRKFLSHSVHIF